jgi:hypothetical protein
MMFAKDFKIVHNCNSDQPVEIGVGTTVGTTITGSGMDSLELLHELQNYIAKYVFLSVDQILWRIFKNSEYEAERSKEASKNGNSKELRFDLGCQRILQKPAIRLADSSFTDEEISS